MQVNEQDLVSIVVPVYNSEAYLSRCIRSLCAQSYKNLEIILVDDGSEDHSLEVCFREAKEDGRIKVLHKENGGAASARNAGMEEMSGQWLILIDGDDYIHQDMVRDLLAGAKAGQAQTTVGGFERVYEDGRAKEVHALELGKEEGQGQVWSGSLHEFGERLFLKLYQNLMLRTQSNKLYSVPLIREQGLRYPEGISINEDIWFCVRYLSCCGRIACIPGSYLYYWQAALGDSLIGRYHPEGVESCFLLLSAMDDFMDKAKASSALRRVMDQEMLFHICGFAGHSYYRTDKPLKECLGQIRELAKREGFRELLGRIHASGREEGRKKKGGQGGKADGQGGKADGQGGKADGQEGSAGIQRKCTGGQERSTGIRGRNPDAPKGMMLKNRIAAFLLGHKLCRLYHWLCVGLYGRQRRAFLKNRRIGVNVMKTEGNSGKPMVSISCVTFNHEAYIARALDSYLMQKTDFDFEILVYDDASTDKTQEIIREYEKRYPGIIKPYYQTENQYSQGKYNVEGFYNYPRAAGKYIAMSDGDDYWTDERKLQMQVDYMESHPECAMCLHSARIETQEKSIQSLKIRPYRKSRLIPPQEVIDKASNYPTASLLFRTEYAKDLQDYYYVSPVGDIPIQLHMAAKGTVYYMDREMSVYRQGVSVSWSALMKQGDYKQNLIDHHNAMKVMYRGFSKETGGLYDHAIQSACRRMDFLTLLNVKEYREALAPGYRKYYRELDLRTRFFIRFELLAPGLYRFLRRLAFGKDRC